MGRSETIGLVVPEIANPFFARLAAAIESAAGQVGLGLVLSATLNRREREFDYIDRMRRNRVDGLIFLTNEPDDGKQSRALNETPGVVLVDEDIPGARVPKVLCDNEMGGLLAGRTPGTVVSPILGAPRGWRVPGREERAS
jgi:LacI family transcriptional regulator